MRMTFTHLEIFILSSLIAFVTIPLILKYGGRFGLYDRSVERRRKAEEKARFGGIGIYLAIVVSLGVTFLSSSWLSGLILTNLRDSLALFFCVTIIFALGSYDDLKGANATKKLMIQILASIFLYLFGYKITLITNPLGFILGPGSLFLPEAANFLLTMFWLVGITNAFNLTDGLDGLAAGVTFFCSLTMMIISFHLGHPLISFFFLALAGSTFGFLPYNMPRARIIMGDSGSLTLGFLFAALSLKGSIKGALGISFIIPVLIVSPSILDTVWAVIRRSIQGRAFFTADIDHIHHRMRRSVDGSWKALLTLYGIYIAFCMLGLILVFSVSKEIILSVYILSFILVIFLFYKIGYLHDVGEWLLVRRYGRRMIRARNVQELWGNFVETVKRLEFLRVRLEITKNLGLEVSGKKDMNCEEGDVFLWQSEDKTEKVRPLQSILELEGKSGKLGRLILEKSPSFSKAPINPSPTVDMLQRYVSQGLDKLISL
jgi:UDP-GlcNAc:undecaprenyl-phosphate GlcNAc-1-phosphate transferase